MVTTPFGAPVIVIVLVTLWALGAAVKVSITVHEPFGVHEPLTGTADTETLFCIPTAVSVTSSGTPVRSSTVMLLLTDAPLATGSDANTGAKVYVNGTGGGESAGVMIEIISLLLPCGEVSAI